MRTPVSSFLHERNPNLHTSAEVEYVAGYLRAGGDIIPNEPAYKISAYLGFLANRDYVNDGILTGDQKSTDRQIDAHMIEPEDVPEGYFDLRRRIAREQGHGDIQITPEMRQEAQRIISADQRHSLKSWAEYLSGDDAGYPDWFRLYAFDSLLKMGKFDAQKEEFQKRSKQTTVPFPELNRGALSQVYTWIKEAKIDDKEIKGVFDDDKSEAAFQRALKSGNFAKLYVQAIHKTQEGMITLEQKTEIKGSWKQYTQGSNPKVLHGDLQGFGLDWCTATGYETAVTHIRGGDFYVYYTRDEDGMDTVPRVAIRMEQGEVAEVRGVNTAQELEPVMVDITAEQLKDLPGGEEYIRKAEDMKRLTTIEKKVTANSEADLTNEEVYFLYELDHEIEGFGYECDPRIAEIKTVRGDRDRQELKRIVAESIHEQLGNAFTAYKTVTEQLGENKSLFRKGEAISQTELGSLFALKDKEWQENGVYDYLLEQFLETRARFTLVVKPNIEASEAQLVALAESFGEDQPHTTYVRNEFYWSGRYKDSEWSGNSGSAPVKLSLISDREDRELSGKSSAEEQVRMLRERQACRPKLNVRVPSLLEAITYWYSLRAGGDNLDHSSAFYKTYIRHFDLEPQLFDGLQHVPGSYVANDGRPSLDRSATEFESAARVAVG